MLIQKLQRAKLYTVFLAIQCLCLVSACGGGGGGSAQAAPTTPSAPNAPATPQTIAAPTITATAAQNGAVIISMSSTTSGAAIYYSTDGKNWKAISPPFKDENPAGLELLFPLSKGAVGGLWRLRAYP